MNGQSLQTIQTKMSASAGLQSNRVLINVGGVRFETYKTTLQNIPDTRLAWITESKSENPDFDPLTGEYFFDRHPNMFLMILNYYRTGKLHVPSDVCGPAFEDELAFWGIDEKQIESCCWGTYSQHRDAQQTLEELQLDPVSHNDDSTEDADHVSTAQKFGILEETTRKSRWREWKPKIWAILDDPSSSKLAKAFTSISLLLTVTVIVCFILETEPIFRVLKNQSNPLPTNYTLQEYRVYTKPSPVFDYIEAVCMVELTIELILKLVFCPSKVKFLKNPLNWVDIVSILSFYISVLLSAVNADVAYDTHLLLHFLRLFRVFRIFNLARHLRGLKILFHTIKASATELLLMLILIISLGTIFATLIHFVEQIAESDMNNFETIFDGLWWSIVTMTTLGYGDKVPKTHLGYVVGFICAICGVLFIALPIPIIVNNFSIYYTHAQAQEKLPKKRKNILVGAADALKQQAPDLQSTLHCCDTISEVSSTQSIDGSDTASTAAAHHSDDSGVNDSSITSDKNGGGGISVVFTDEGEKNGRFSKNTKVHPQSNDTVGQNGVHVPNTSPDKSFKRTVNKLAPALIRRSSLLPGGVSYMTQGNHRAPVPLKSTDPRERRQSLVPVSANQNH